MQYNFFINDQKPNDPWYSRFEFYISSKLGAALLICSIFSVFFYFVSFISLLVENDTHQFFKLTGVFVIFSIINFFVLSVKRDKKQFAKKYFLIIYGGTVNLCAIIAVIISITEHKNTFSPLFICSVITAIILTPSIIVMSKKIKVNVKVPQESIIEEDEEDDEDISDLCENEIIDSEDKNGRIINDITNYIFVSDKPQKADIIFLPGGSFPQQGEYAAELYKQGYADKLLPSGGVSIKTG